MLAYVREISGTGGWVAESLKHLSFLLASPCGAQIAYSSMPRPLRELSGVSAPDTESRLNGDVPRPLLFHTLGRPREPTQRPSEGRKG